MERSRNTQLQRLDHRLRYDRRDLQTILVCALVGSMTGAFCTGFSGYSIRVQGVYTALGSLPLSALRLSLFPVLTTAAMLLRSRRMLRLLFFGKSFAVAFVLCIAAASGVGPLRSLFPGLLLETLLPLPGFFLLGALWYGQTRNGPQLLWPLLPVLLPALGGLLFERLLTL